MTTQIGAALSNPYITPDPVPPVAVLGVLETTITASLGPIVSGTTPVNAEVYNGAIPGPTLRLSVGDTVIVRLVNNLPYPTGIHWHGIELANSADGTEVTQDGVVPAFPVAPPPPAPAGGTYLYKFKVTRPGIFWYHPHHHHSPNRVFRGLYGMIVVTDPDDTTLEGNTLPSALDTKQLVLSDITVCKAVGANLPYDLTLPWVGTTTPGPTFGMALPVQPGLAPVDLCQLPNAVDDHGDPALADYAPGDVPSVMHMTGRINEGMTVLTNGVNVGARAGSPSAPGAVAAGAYKLPVLSGQGLRLQIVNCATTRYFRLILTTSGMPPIALVRIGGEGGLLDSAVLEGGITGGGLDTKHASGEILLPPSVRADIVAAIPPGLPPGTVLTLWTQDFPRLQGFTNTPTVPVMHLEVTGAAATAYTIGAGTALRAKMGFPGSLVPTLGAANATLLTPLGGFVPPKLGMSNQDIELTSGTPSINGVQGSFEGAPPYTSALHIGSSRYAEEGRILQLTVTNMTSAHHPFHLHGFSIQPKSLMPRVGAPATTTGGIPTWPYQEFRDSIDVPANYTLTFRVQLANRELVDGVTLGGSLGRWLFHCHIFFHHHRGMISELVVTDVNGKEKPYVDVGGSWAYAPSGATATRRGTFSSPDGPPGTTTIVTLVAETVTPAGVRTPLGVLSTTPPLPAAAGTWSWSFTSVPMAPPGTDYVYITATDSLTRKGQAVFRLKIGAPDDGSDNGDPHIHTVDGKSYDFQAAGEFTLLRDRDGMEIQSRQTPVLTANPITDSYSGLTSCVSLNTAVAARVGSHRIAYQPGHERSRLQFLLDGKPAQLSIEGIDLEGHRVSAFDVGGKTGLRVDYEHGPVLMITPLFWTSHGLSYLDVSVSHTDGNEGIMGSIHNGTWLPALPSGATVGPMPASLPERYFALYRTFANAWRVTDKTSLFVYEPGTSTATFTDEDWPAEKPPCRLKPQFAIPGVPTPVNIEIERAKQICRGVTIDDLHRNCVFDVATTGDETFAWGYLVAQDQRLHGSTVQIVGDKASTRPGEPLVVTAMVLPMHGGGPTPAGSVSFVVDGAAARPPVKLDEHGRARFTARLGVGAHRIRAAYTPGGGEHSYHASSSPNLLHAVQAGMGPANGKWFDFRTMWIWITLAVIIIIAALVYFS